MPVILFNPQPIINFAYLGFLPAWLSVMLYAAIIRFWYKALRRYQSKRNNKDLLRLITGPLIIIGSYIGLSIIVGWHMYFTGVVTFLIIILGCVIIPGSMEYHDKYPKHSAEIIKSLQHNLKHPIIFLTHNN